MEQLQQWAISLCAAAAVGGLFSALSPSSAMGKALRVAASLLFLCIMFAPVQNMFDLRPMPAFFSDASSAGLSEELQKNTQDFAYLLAESHINGMIQKTMSEHQISWEESQVYLKNEEGSIQIYAVVYLTQGSIDREEEVKNLIRHELGIHTECRTRQEDKTQWN